MLRRVRCFLGGCVVGGCVGAILSIILFGAIPDAFDLFCLRNSTYTTPWYDERWWRQPVTHAMLGCYDSQIKLATNVTGAVWVVKETKVGKKTYWTRLYIVDK
jgi:hypothetical protein